MRSLKKIILFITLIQLSYSCDTPNTKTKANQDSETQLRIDSITTLIEQSKDYSHSEKKRGSLLKEAYNINKALNSDSLKLHQLIDLAQSAMILKNNTLFKQFNNEAFFNSNKNNDTLGLAKTHYYYGYRYYDFSKRNDSAYYHFNKARKYNIILKRQLPLANTLVSLSFVYNDMKNYIHSEILTFQALSIYSELKESYGLFTCYSDLGDIYTKLKKPNKALYYETKALNVIDPKSFEKGLSKSFAQTAKPRMIANMGTSYFYAENYKEALRLYTEVYKNKGLKNKDITLYLAALHGLNLSKFKSGDTVNVIKNLNEVLRIYDSIEHHSDKVDLHLDIAECYIFKKDSSNSLYHVKKARELASKYNDIYNYLKSLKALAPLDTQNTSTHLKEYIHLNDSIENQEIKTRNKYSKIEFETNKQVKEVERLSQQQLIILITIISSIIILGLFYYIKTEQTKTAKLEFDKIQLKANKEIYNLLLEQQSKIDEGRTKERHRISEELHDGIIGRIFGTRLSFGFLTFKGSKQEIERFKRLVNELQEIEKKIRDVSHALKDEL